MWTIAAWTGWMGLALTLALAPVSGSTAGLAAQRPARPAWVDAAPEVVLSELRAMHSPPSPTETRTLVLLLREGQLDPVTDTALRALTGARGHGAQKILLAYTHHRRPSARIAALRALSSMRAPGERKGRARGSAQAEAQLIEGLSDPDPTVRQACAELLAQRGATEALPALWRALEQGDAAAAGAVGALCPPAELGRFEALVGKLPLNVVLPGVRALLLRDDLPAPHKLRLLGQLAELAGPEVARFLEELQDGLSERGGVRARAARVLREVRAGLGGTPREVPP